MAPLDTFYRPGNDCRPDTPPQVLCIGGTEATGVAGLAADIRAVHAMGAHALPVVSTVTSQRVAALDGQAVDGSLFRAQLDSALEARPSAIKVGLLASTEQAQIIVQAVQGSNLPLIFDPVCVSSNGQALSQDDSAAIRAILLPVTTLVTPNQSESRLLMGPETTPAEWSRKHDIAVLEKGGHRDTGECQDEFVDGALHFELTGPRINTAHQRGTGCCLAASISAALALGFSLADAVVLGKVAVGQALRNSYAVGPAGGALGVQTWDQPLPDLPALRMLGEDAPARAKRQGGDIRDFPDCGNSPIGIYPVVDRADWLARLLPCGISTIQLRVKDLQGEALEAEIVGAISIARRFGARLFINDHWQLALQHGASGVHLGQEDLATADLVALQGAGLRLGISTHCLWELARAASIKPSYLACGPVYPTTSKIMPWAPQGEAGLRFWRQLVPGKPLVAIGGIGKAHIGAVIEAGACGVAMISSLCASADPERSAREFVGQFEAHCR